MSDETKGKRSELATTLAILESLSDAMGERATLRHARLLLEVAVAGEVDQGAIAKKIGSTATVRMVQALGPAAPYKDGQGRRREGLGLVRSEQDDVDYRLRRLTLTPKGERLITEIAKRAGQKK